MPTRALSPIVDAEALIARVASWVQCDVRVVAACVCGSHARGDTKPDSDIDFCLVCPEPISLLEDHSWLDVLGADARVVGRVEDYGLVQSLRVFYGDVEAEFGIAGMAWIELPIDPGTASVINDGLRILYDPERRLHKAVEHAATLLS